MSAASSGNLYSAPAVTREQSICRAWRLWGRAADLLITRQERPCYPGPSGPLPVPGEAESWAVPAPCAPGPALLDFRSRPHSHLTVEPPPEPLQVAPGA